MYKIKRFFDILWRSISDRAYYADILRATFGFSVKYLLFLLFLLSLASTLRYAAQFLPNYPKIETGIIELKRTIGLLYPADLVVTIKEGNISTNMKEPYNFDLPYDWAKEFNEGKKHLLTINTAATPQDYYTSDSVILVTKTSLIVLDNSGVGYRVLPLSEFKENITIDKAFYDEFVLKLTPYLDMVQPLALVFVVLAIFFGPFLGMAFGFSGKLLYLLFTTFIVRIIAKIVRVPYGYKTLYRLSMHGLTLPILATFVLGVFGVYVPFLFTLLFITWMTIVLVYLRDSERKEIITPPAA